MAPPKNKIQNPRGWRERKGRRASDTVPAKETKRSWYASSERGDASKSGHSEQQRGTERSEERRRDGKIRWKVKNKSVLQPSNYFNLHRIMNAAIKNNKKDLFTPRVPRCLLAMCKESVNTDERRLTRDNQPEKRGEKETGEKGGTKRGENRADIESCVIGLMSQRVNYTASIVKRVRNTAESRLSDCRLAEVPYFIVTSLCLFFLFRHFFTKSTKA